MNRALLGLPIALFLFAIHVHGAEPALEPNQFLGLSSAQPDEFNARMMAYQQAVSKAAGYFGLQSSWAQATRLESSLGNSGEQLRESHHMVHRMKAPPRWLFGREVYHIVEKMPLGYVARCLFELDVQRTRSHLEMRARAAGNTLKEASTEAGKHPHSLSLLFRAEAARDSLHLFETLLGRPPTLVSLPEDSLLPLADLFERRLEWTRAEGGTLRVRISTLWPFHDPGLAALLWPVTLVTADEEAVSMELSIGTHELPLQGKEVLRVCWDSQWDGRLAQMCPESLPGTSWYLTEKEQR